MEGPNGVVGDALRHFGAVCLPLGESSLNDEDRYKAAVAWREALVKAFDTDDMTTNDQFLQLPEEAMVLLLESDAVHSKPAELWGSCVKWAWTRKDRELLPSKTQPWCKGPSFEKPPKKMFAAGARTVTVSHPRPADHEVDWQRWLIPVAERTRFKDMPAGAFVAHMDNIDPMLPELRQVIYRVRRQGIRIELAKNTISPLQKLLMDVGGR